MLASTVTLNVFGEEGRNYSWYYKRNSEHKQPVADSEMLFIEDHDAYYVDKAHSDEKIVYLTFDVGYENGNVEKTLDILKNNNITANFFVLEHFIKKSPQLVSRMANEGHLVGNHTANHKDTSVLSYNELKTELETIERLYLNETGRELAKFFRPPEGRFSKQSLINASKLGYKTVFWSFAYADWDNNNQMSEEKAKEKILSNIHNGAIILLHPTSKTNAAILDDVIKELQSQGFSFKTLDYLKKLP
jgi:peptidoglycan-N-acetylmuramic acid deacetylase